MTWGDLLWLPPLMIAVSIVIGASGRNGFRHIAKSIWNTFVALTIGVVAVGLVVHVIASIFS